MGLIQTYVPWVEKPPTRGLNPDSVLTQGLEFAVDFTEGAGDPHDTVTGRPLTRVNGPVWSRNLLDGSMEMDFGTKGQDKKLTGAAGLWFPGSSGSTGPWTIWWRGRLAAPISGNGYIPFANSTPTKYWQQVSTTRANFAGNNAVTHDAFDFADGDYHDVVWTANDGNDVVPVFADGKALRAAFAVPGFIAWDADVMVGGYTNASFDFGGSLNFFRVYNYSWTPEIVQHAYQNPNEYWAPLRRDIPVGIPGVAPGGNPTISLNQGLSTVIDATEAEIAAGGTSAFIEITDGSFKPQGLMTTAERQQIVAGCQDISTEANRVEWDKVIAATQAVADANVVVLPGEATVAIQFAPTPTYNIATDAEVQFIAPTALYTATP